MGKLFRGIGVSSRGERFECRRCVPGFSVVLPICGSYRVLFGASLPALDDGHRGYSGSGFATPWPPVSWRSVLKIAKMGRFGWRFGAGLIRQFFGRLLLNRSGRSCGPRRSLPYFSSRKPPDNTMRYEVF